MGQQEVYDFLSKHKGKLFTAKQVADNLIENKNTVNMSLYKLKKHGEIECIRMSEGRFINKYRVNE